MAKFETKDYHIDEVGSVLSISEIMEGVPAKDSLLLVDALFFAVYGWTPGKIRKMKLDTVSKWVEHAKKRMTWEDAYRLRRLLEGKKGPKWKKILKTVF